ncbi:hypothetical protein [Kocuria massiliensis]|uniref:hypothetical protein n=1 Tax=Kocuria massiliensis TaxID=1926282 RepID=UPI0022B9B277|nr:hypothetical protein [Kocuria massiliensis]
MDTKKTVGPITNANAGGAGGAGALGVIIVWILTDGFGFDVPTEVAAAIAVLCAVIGGYIGGYLAPSQAGAVASAVRENSYSPEEIADHVAQKAPTAVVPTADDVADAVVKKTDPSYTAKHSVSAEPAFDSQAAQADTVSDYPDLDALAQPNS